MKYTAAINSKHGNSQFALFFSELIASKHAEKQQLNKSLFEAVKANDVALAASLIKQGAVINPKYNYSMSLTGDHLFVNMEC